MIDWTTQKIKIAELNEDKYKVLVEEYDYSLILLYEDWCGYSEKAVKIFKKMSKSKDFEDMDIPIGFFNLGDYKHFRQVNDIKSIPLIQLSIHKNVINY